MNMNTREQDPFGQAILDFTKSKKPFDIIVKADLCDDEHLSQSHLGKEQHQGKYQLHLH